MRLCCLPHQWERVLVQPVGQGMDHCTSNQHHGRNNAPATGRSAQLLAKLPAKGWKQVGLRAWKQSSEDNIGLVAAGVAFYAFLALVPLLAATVLSYGLIAAPETVLKNVRSLTTVMPPQAAKLVGEQLLSVVQTSAGKKGVGLLLALAIALFGARNAAGSVITALNIAYEEKESRGFIKLNLLALAITASAVALGLIAMIAVAALGYLQKIFPHLPGKFLLVDKLGSYALLLAATAAGAATLYRYGPDRQNAKWTWVSLGSIFASFGWIMLTLGFGFYAANFANYGKTYGSLATVIVLLTWTYLSAYVLLLGAELNSEHEHQAAKVTTVEAPEPTGHREAWSGDHAVDGDEFSKPRRGFVIFPNDYVTTQPLKSPSEHSYLTSRVTARAAKMAGGANVGMLGSALATIGLAMLRRKGRGGIGAVLLGCAAGIALLSREQEDAQIHSTTSDER